MGLALAALFIVARKRKRKNEVRPEQNASEGSENANAGTRNEEEARVGPIGEAMVIGDGLGVVATTSEVADGGVEEEQEEAIVQEGGSAKRRKLAILRVVPEVQYQVRRLDHLACTLLYKSLCRSVRPSVGPSVNR